RGGDGARCGGDRPGGARRGRRGRRLSGALLRGGGGGGRARARGGGGVGGRARAALARPAAAHQAERGHRHDSEDGQASGQGMAAGRGAVCKPGVGGAHPPRCLERARPCATSRLETTPTGSPVSGETTTRCVQSCSAIRRATRSMRSEESTVTISLAATSPASASTRSAANALI